MCIIDIWCQQNNNLIKLPKFLMQLTFIQLKSNFLKGGGKELLVWILALAASISCSVVHVMSTWWRGKNLKFRCSQDRIKRIESVTDSFDILHDDSQQTWQVHNNSGAIIYVHDDDVIELKSLLLSLVNFQN